MDVPQTSTRRPATSGVRFRYRDVTEYPADYSGLMLAARITLPHFSVSAAMNLPKSAAEPVRATRKLSAWKFYGVPPKPRNGGRAPLRLQPNGFQFTDARHPLALRLPLK